jgi:hypothetical protein
MPGEEQDDIVMTSTQCSLLNITCPLSGKPVVDLAEPVRRYSESVQSFSCFLIPETVFLSSSPFLFFLMN